MSRKEREGMDRMAAQLFFVAVGSMDMAAHSVAVSDGVYDSFKGVLLAAGFEEDIFLQRVEGEAIPAVVYARGTIHADATGWLRESIESVQRLERTPAITFMAERIKTQREAVATQS